MIETLEKKIYSNQQITMAEAMALIDAPLKELTEAADRIRKHFCGDVADVCSCINVKGGKCSEDCIFCPQSYVNPTKVDPHFLDDKSTYIEKAKAMEEAGINRCDLVSNGKCLPQANLDKVIEHIKEIKKNSKIEVCCSFGLLDEAALKQLKDAGVTRIHNNLETSEEYFKTLCTTHTTDEKKATLKIAKKLGFNICSGCLIGLGETMGDRVKFAFEEREIGCRSMPVNIYNPVADGVLSANTPLTTDEFCRTIAIFRFILPDIAIRLAAGRINTEDYGSAALSSGANAIITGNFLTTSGISISSDMAMLKSHGLNPGLIW